MARIFLSFLLFLSVAVSAQNMKDSLRSYQQQLSELRSRYNDSLRLNPLYAELNEKIQKISATSDSYGGYMLYAQSSTADFTKINQEITAAGFPAMSGNLWGIGYGFTYKRNRRIFDMQASTVGLKKESKMGDAKVTTALSGLLDLLWGYDVVKSNRFNLYPFAGVGLRSTHITYEAPVTVNPAATGFLNVVMNNRSVKDDKLRLGYQVGMGAELVLTSPQHSGGTLIFIKAGTNRPFGKEEFNFEGLKYDAKMKAGELSVSAGFKFFGRGRKSDD